MDKFQHMIAGVFVALVTSIVLVWLFDMGDEGYLKASIVLGMAMLFGAGKEAWDYFTDSGVPEIYDFLATALGGLIVASIIIFI